MIGRLRGPHARRDRSRIDVPARLAALEQALELAEGPIDHEVVERGRQVAAKAAERLRHGTTHTLVSLLGATGSGKSSVTNALVGSDVATTGVRRPTTSSTLACVWGHEDASALLDWLEVPNRYEVPDSSVPDNSLDGLVLLDVPDHDSVAVGHRLEMERIARHADLMLWVTDPEKYADEAMHRYLRRLTGHGAVTVMVLNKADRLDTGVGDGDRNGDQATAVRNDLSRLLDGDGLQDAPVFLVSATNAAGIEPLRDMLRETVAKRQAMVERLAADLESAADELTAVVGSDETPTLSKVTAEKLIDDLVGATGIGVVADAVAAGHRRDAADRTGWPFTRWVRRLRPHPLRRLHLDRGSAGRTSLPQANGSQVSRAMGAIRETADQASDGLTDPWPDHLRRAATPNEVVLRDRLDGALADAVRKHQVREPRWWQLIGVLQIGLAVATVVGLAWLLGLAVAGYLQLPELPTPSVREIPIPTGLAIAGALLGWILAVLSRRLAGLGARRAAARTRRSARIEIESVAEELVLGPLRFELDRRNRLVELLQIASG